MGSDISIAVIVHQPDDESSTLLTNFALSARERGVRIKGVVQRPLPNARTHKDSELFDLENGRSYPLFQKLGAGSSSCSVDNSSIAAASVALRNVSAHDTDLVVINRFGGLEAQNNGFAAEMLYLMSEGIPLLTAVSGSHLAAWRQFTGGAGVELPPRIEAIDDWFALLSQKRGAA